MLRFRLLGGEDLDEAVRERIEAIGARHVPVQRRRLELRQHEDVAQAGVDAVADRNVDQPVLAGQRHGRLAAQLRQRIQPRPAPTTQDDCHHSYSRLAKYLSKGGWSTSSLSDFHPVRIVKV